MAEDPVVRLHLPVDASTGKLLYEHGDEVRNPRGFPGIDYKTTVVFAFEFLNRMLSANLLWNLTAHPLDAGKTYVLSGGCDQSADASPMFLSKTEGFNLPGDWPDGSDPDPALGRLTFRVMIGDEYFAAIAGNHTLREFCSMTVIIGSGSSSAVTARIPFYPRKRADESAGGSGSGNGMTTTVNGLYGSVILADTNGNPLPVSGQTITFAANGNGLQADNDPLDAYQAYSDMLGPYTWLDNTDSSPTLIFFKYQRYLKKVTFLALADNEESSGDVRLIAAVDGVDVATFTVAITAEAESVTLPLEVTAGMLTIRRDADDELDTLDCAVRIFAVSTWRAA